MGVFLRQHIIDGKNEYKFELDHLFGDFFQYEEDIENMLSGLNSITNKNKWFSFSDPEEEVIFLFRNTYQILSYT